MTTGDALTSAHRLLLPLGRDFSLFKLLISSFLRIPKAAANSPVTPLFEGAFSVRRTSNFELIPHDWTGPAKRSNNVLILFLHLLTAPGSLSLHFLKAVLKT